jgi:hypothetical protein
MDKYSNSFNSKGNIFYKNINNKYKLVPFNVKINHVGNVKYSPADSKEWKNKIYFFNQNNLKNLPVYDIIINKLLKSYFNIYFKNKVILKKYISRKFIRSSFNKIYISKPEIRHTNSKAIITIYVFNRENISLMKNIRKLKKNFIFLSTILRVPEHLKKRLKRNFFFNTFFTFIKGKSKFSDNLEFYNKIFKLMLYKQIIFLRRYKLKLNLNKYKFHNIFLYKLGNLISRIFNKKIEFNIINLQSIALNSDIFTEFVKQKLKRRDIQVGRVLNFILARVRLIKENSIIERARLIKNIDFNLLENKYKNINLNHIIGNHGNVNIFLKKRNSITKYIFLKKRIYSSLIKKMLFDSIQYKKLAGIRLEVKGRLSKRYRADRAVYKIRLKGGLKNIDSAFKGLSTVTFRGYANSNVEYSIRTSKRRIGAFAVKGWISGK